MIYAIPHSAGREPAAAVRPDAVFHDLGEYIEHKIGSSIPEIKADSPERFRVIEEEALRDLAVMSRITGTDYIVRLLPDTLANPECARLVSTDTDRL